MNKKVVIIGIVSVVVVGAGIGGYMWYKKKKGADAPAAAPAKK